MNQVPLVTMITTTGSRPEAIKLCEKYVKAMDCKYTQQWIVINDTPTIPIKIQPKGGMTVEIYNGPMEWKPGLNTQRPNLTEALKHIKGEYIFIIEDDDAYLPNYLETHLDCLKNCKAVGVGDAQYYNLKVPGYKRMFNTEHSSLAQTAFHKALLPQFTEAVHSGQYYIDIVFWEKVRSQGIPCMLQYDLNTSIGMKGLPGREGLGVGHKGNDFMFDGNYEVLKKWLGVHHANYLPWIKKPPGQKVNFKSQIPAPKISAISGEGQKVQI